MKLLTLFLLLFMPLTVLADNENFTTYTENDPGSDLTVTSPKIDAVAMNPASGLYNMYSDKGTDFFNAVDIDVEFFMTSGSESNAQFGPALVNTSTPDDEKRTTLAATDLWFEIYSRVVGPDCRIYLVRGPFDANDVWNSCVYSTRYYNTLERAADNDTATFKIYSDSDRTSLVDTLTLAGYGTGTKWQYLYGLIIHADGSDIDNTGSIENMDAGIAAPVVPPAKTPQSVIWFNE